MFFHDDCNKKTNFIQTFLYIRAVYVILINKLKSDLEGSGSNPMSHAYCVARGKRTRAFIEGPGFESGSGHGGGGSK